MMVAAMLILIFGISSLRPFTTPPAVASVTIDMTPNVEFTIGKGNTVAKVKAHNKEGLELLKEIDIEGLDIYQAVNIITAKAAEMGFFKPEDKNVAIATIVPLGNDEKLDKAKIMQTIHDEMYAKSLTAMLLSMKLLKKFANKQKKREYPSIDIC